MKKRTKLFTSLLILTSFLLGGALPIYAATNDAPKGKYVPDEIIISFKERSNFAGREKQYDDEVAKVLKDGLERITENTYLVKSEDFKKNPNATLNKYKNSEFINYVEPNHIFDGELAPNDPNYKTYCAPLTKAMNTEAAWDITTKSSVIIAIIDTGFVTTHKDLPTNAITYNILTKTSTVSDAAGHGTAVAGVIAAKGNNATGNTGVIWDALIMPIKTTDGATMTASNISSAILFAADNKARVINMSLGSTADNLTLKNACETAFNKGCVLVAATGNESSTAVCYPAAYPTVIGVGAMSNATTKAPTSNSGKGLDVMAMYNWYTTTTNGAYALQAGTSIASPQVAALAALVWEVAPKLSNSQVVQLIKDNTDRANGVWDSLTGYGLVDMGKTLAAAQKLAGNAPVVEQPKPKTPPVITLNGESMIQMNDDEKFVDPGATAKDEVDGDLTTSIKTTGTVKATEVGVYTLTYTVTNKSGLSGTATRTVVVNKAPVIDTTPPELTLLGETELEMLIGETFIEPGFTSVDDIDGDITDYVEVEGEVDGEVVGEYVLTYKSTDKAGNTATAERKIEVVNLPAEEEYDLVALQVPDPVEDEPIVIEIPVDNPAGVASEENPEAPVEPEVVTVVRYAPTIQLVGSKEIRLHLGSKTEYKEQGATAWDDYDGDLSGKVTIIGHVDRNKPGNYIVTYTVTNSAGLSASVSRGVQIAELRKIDRTQKPDKFSYQAKKGDKPIENQITVKDGIAGIKISGLNKFTVRVQIYNEKNTLVYSLTTATDTNEMLNVPLPSGKYKVTSEITDGNGNNKYSVDIEYAEDWIPDQGDIEVPLVRVWSLANLILLIGIALLMIAQFAVLFVVSGVSNNQFSIKEEINKHFMLMIASAAIVIIGIILFRTTLIGGKLDKSLMVSFDPGTIWMYILLLSAQLVVTYFSTYQLLFRRKEYRS